MQRKRSLRLLGATVAIAFAHVIVGCSSTIDSGPARHLVPISASLRTSMAEKGMSQADPILIRIFKLESELEVWKRGRNGNYALLRTWPICRWSGQLGPKNRDGDRQAPEGFYSVTPDLMNPRSQFHLSFNLGYPNAVERARGASGSALMVHGACTSSGCFAVSDAGIAEIYALAREAFASGQQSVQVQAFPFRMTPENTSLFRNNPNIAFWRNLKEGSDHFEATLQPPKVSACGNRYVFNASERSGPFVPGAMCPRIDVDPTIVSVVAERRARDDVKAEEFLKAQTLAVAIRHEDGGMHDSFRQILRSQGAERLQALTSGRVEVSRPQAALADPFDPAINPLLWSTRRGPTP